MVRNVWLWTILLTMTFTFTSCKDDPGATPGKVSINGVVSDASTGQPLPGVSVRAQTPASAPVMVATDAQGAYTVSFDADSATSISMLLTKSGYRDTTIIVKVNPGVAFPLSVQLSPKSVVTGGGGSAQTIAFLGADPVEVSVYGVGGQETSILSWEVRDSLGLAIDAAHAVTLNFVVVGNLGGGEYISPANVTTNAVGRAYTTFNSGIRSGVIQIVASTTVGTRTIASTPVRIIINAGLPAQSHFTIGAERRNFPALGVVGKINKISVLVGDKYSNPVVPGTAVYFNSAAGVIQASAFTSNSGQGTVNLYSGNPFPPNGYHYVTARTIGENSASIRDSLLLLWSGVAQTPVVTPSTFNIPNGQYQDFSFNVSDQNGNPLAEGTSITVNAVVSPPPDPLAPVNQVQLAFGIQGSITLPDVIFPGPGTTDFTFRLSDGTFTIDTLTAVTVSISVVSPAGGNGNAYRSINGTVR